jgi:hypothetical protein
MFDFIKPAKHTTLTRSDWAAIEAAVDTFSTTLKERFQGLDKEIEELRQELAAVKREPRLSLRQKINQKGK